MPAAFFVVTQMATDPGLQVAPGAAGVDIVPGWQAKAAQGTHFEFNVFCQTDMELVAYVCIMCGRYFLHSDLDKLTELFGQLDGTITLSPRYNIAPTQPVPVVRADAQGRRHIALVRWGLVPSWAREPDTKYSMINARAETVAEKPAFRSAFRYRRCLIPADGFYEWQKTLGGRKQPYCIRHAEDQPMALAGIWETWQAADGSELESCAILVTSANATVAPVHDRMPVIVDPSDFGSWLNRHLQHPDELEQFLQPAPTDLLRLYPVNTRVNNPQNDSKELIEPK